MFFKKNVVLGLFNHKTNPTTAFSKKKKKRKKKERKKKPRPRARPRSRVLLTTPSVVQIWEGNDIGPAWIC